MNASNVTRSLAAITLAVVAAFGVTGCFAKSTAYNGKFTFAYASGLDVENFVKPIAPGAKLDVVAFANGTEDKLTINKATSSKPGVVAITSVDENKVVLRGVTPGVSDIEITTIDARGNTLVDHMFFHVDKPAAHKLEHACTEEADATYVQGDQAVVFHQLATADGRPVIGYDYAPIRVQPASALELLPPRQGASGYAFKTTKKAARITVKSTVDDSSVNMRVIGREDIKQATLSSGSRVLERGSIWVFARTTYGDAALCSQNSKTLAKSLTPDICSVTAKLDDDDNEDDATRSDDDEKDSNRWQVAVVKGLKFGICKYEVTLPELDGGKGIRLTGEAKVGRVEFPGEGNTTPEAAPPKAPSRLMLGAAAWLLIGTGWVAPSIIALVALAITRRKRR